MLVLLITGGRIRCIPGRFLRRMGVGMLLRGGDVLRRFRMFWGICGSLGKGDFEVESKRGVV